MLCINCSNKLDHDSVFCDNCGQKVVAATPIQMSATTNNLCPGCGEETEIDDVFCYFCRHRLPSFSGGIVPQVQQSGLSAHYHPSPQAAQATQHHAPPSIPAQPVARTRVTIPPSNPAQQAGQSRHIPSVHPANQGGYAAPQQPIAALPRMPLVFLLETSAASGAYIKELNAALNRFKSEVSMNGQAAAILDVAIMQFGDGVDVLQGFAPVANMNPVRLITAGSANFSQSVQQAVQMAENQRNSQSTSYKPWVVLVSGNNPSDDITAVSGMVQNLQQADKLRLMALSVGGQNLTALKQLTDVVFRLDDMDFISFFSWLSGCMGAIAQTSPGEKPQLPQLQGNVYRDK